ncbi:DNA repair protein RecO [Paenibacillus hodogayensis]|uniref:DNA repair protein RecO n=1 Tax=Paenibacillus hodogayensis TaxID=279208 RepID=A0ABV5VQJ4_9BACL
MLIRFEGIVIRTFDYGEGDKICSVFSKELGKISMMARGAKKLKSRHAAVAQLFTHGEFTCFKAGSMGTLNNGELLNPFTGIKEDIHKTAYASYLMELTDKTVGENEPNGPLFEQLKAALTAIDEGKDPKIVVNIYEMLMLSLAGYMPMLNECVSCGAKPESGWALSVSLGGTVCAACRHLDPAAIVLSDGTLKLMRLFLHMDIRRLGRIEVKEATKKQLDQCIRRFLDAHVDVKWKARGFIDQMEKYGL